MPIVSFKHRGLRALFENGRSPRIGANFQTKLIELMDIVDAATEKNDMQGVSDFHELKGKRAGAYSMHVNGNWCLTFKFIRGDSSDLNFEDYHKK
ncbi:MAG: type II toxin-antitoxin system RelE/ParE family toxin [Proteobacteria bacterium]|nr:type II toxin-antitoxin system RelE/ParE family toxin [Pseudomonadota bacterium]